jgi:peptidyl-prolyl cis-trans isomerase C
LQEQYLVEKLTIDAAKERGIDQSHPEVQERLRQALESAIRAEYIAEIGEDAVSEADVQNAFQDVVANAPASMERRARHILVETQEAANALIIRLEQGADFAELAEENSVGPTAPQGGDLGYFTREQMVPEFSQAAFDLEVGSFTKTPVETQFGFHVILVEEERERAKPAFEDVRDQLRDQLRQAAIQGELQKLRQQVNFEVFDLNGNPLETQASEEAQSSPEAVTEETAPEDDMSPETTE